MAKHVTLKNCSAGESDDKCPNDKIIFRGHFTLKIKFNYDASNALLLASNKDLTPCENSFSVAFKD